ncbi:hypothetical protein GJ654_10935 [Rhodoblastus acidophilus]|uniref:Uncharacterized protein n=1 Tax=Rhodoblastus acidophilus TaxID=1074 RepID=A0A6N8DLV8_RHOAC|nr:hypothetical protein [Rhodoblastus acidophilus]MCW2274906.1 hypothetical protein [Rhodoblastus acidophilus]MTV31510.1 hypothetical protein [Rhodoblastus acidophilus]
MTYELTICRHGALAGQADWAAGLSGDFSQKNVLQLFKGQAQAIAESSAFAGANSSIGDIARNSLSDRDCFRDEPTENSSGETIVFMQGSDGGGEDAAPIIATLPSRRLICESNGLRWILRTRASVTACALQSARRHAKLWWTFEGVPADTDPDNRPQESHVVAFIKLVGLMEAAAMPLLREAYGTAFNAATDSRLQEVQDGWDRIKIAMADTTAPEAAALVDAMYAEGNHVSDIRATENTVPRRGLLELEELVHGIVGDRPMPNDNFCIVSSVPGSRGVFYREEGQSPDRTVVIGFARQASSSVGYEFLPAAQKRRAKEESVLRVLSAARPISAWLAQYEAKKIDRMLTIKESDTYAYT